MLKTEIRDQIMIATLSDGATNAVTLETLNQLAAAVAQVNETPEIKGLVLTGDGRFFSSGFSLPMFVGFETPEAVVSFFEREEAVLVDYFSCQKPVVCAMNGHSAAMGMILAMASDYRLVADHPKIRLGMSEIKIGLSLSLAQTAVMRFGLDTGKRFRDVMYFGEMFGVAQARKIKLVDEVVAPEALIDRAREIICQWIDTPGRPFIRLKQGLKGDTVARIRQDLAAVDWQTPMANTLMDPDVKATLSFVHDTMIRKK